MKKWFFCEDGQSLNSDFVVSIRIDDENTISNKVRVIATTSKSVDFIIQSFDSSMQAHFFLRRLLTE